MKKTTATNEHKEIPRTRPYAIASQGRGRRSFMSRGNFCSQEYRVFPVYRAPGGIGRGIKPFHVRERNFRSCTRTGTRLFRIPVDAHFATTGYTEIPHYRIGGIGPGVMAGILQDLFLVSGTGGKKPMTDKTEVFTGMEGSVVLTHEPETENTGPVGPESEPALTVRGVRLVCPCCGKTTLHREFTDHREIWIKCISCGFFMTVSDDEWLFMEQSADINDTIRKTAVMKELVVC
jgi:ribosomal protein L37AE/L43A